MAKQDPNTGLVSMRDLVEKLRSVAEQHIEFSRSHKILGVACDHLLADAICSASSIMIGQMEEALQQISTIATDAEKFFTDHSSAGSFARIAAIADLALYEKKT